MSKLVLVTGANGQLGRCLRKSLGLSGLEGAYLDFEELDICSEKSIRSVFSDLKPSVVVNCAAFTAVDQAESDREAAMLLNGEAPGYLANACAEQGSKLIQISTDYVFDGKGFEPYTEDSKTSPQSVYGESKLLGEEKVLEHDSHLVIRTSWLYSNFGKNFLLGMKRLAIERDLVSVVCDQVGTPTSAEDLAQAISKIILEDEAQTGVYHFSNEGAASWYDFAYQIFSFLGQANKLKAIPSSEFPTPAERPKYSVLSKEKIKSDFRVQVPNWVESVVRHLEEVN